MKYTFNIVYTTIKATTDSWSQGYKKEFILKLTENEIEIACEKYTFFPALKLRMLYLSASSGLLIRQQWAVKKVLRIIVCNKFKRNFML